jgi:hypothetical protein
MWTSRQQPAGGADFRQERVILRCFDVVAISGGALQRLTQRRINSAKMLVPLESDGNCHDQVIDDSVTP